MSDECVYMGSVACLTHHSVRRLEEDQDSCDWLRAEKAEAAIEQVRELAEFWKAQVADSPSGASWIYMSAASRLLLDALDGGSDD